MRFKFGLISIIIAFSNLHLCYALTKYDIKAKMDIANQIFSGTQQVVYTNTSSRELNEIYLILLPNLMTDKNPYISDLSNDSGYLEGFDPAWLRIDGISDVAGRQMQYEYVKAPAIISKYSLAKVLLKVNLSRPLPPGRAESFNVAFRTKIPKNYNGDNGFDGETYSWLSGIHPEVISNTAEGWDFEHLYFPKGKYKYEIFVPEGWALYTGSKDDIKVAKNAAGTAYWLENYNLSQSIPVLISNRRTDQTYSIKGINFHFALKSEHQTVIPQLVKMIEAIITFYSPRFGDLPYKQISLAEVNAVGFGGMESDGVMLINSDYFKGLDLLATSSMNNRLLERLIAHELAHLWWGVGIGVDFDRDNWLSEGFAEYLSNLYMRKKYGEEQSMVDKSGNPINSWLLYYLGGDYSDQKYAEDAYWFTRYYRWDEQLALTNRETKHGQANVNRIYSKSYLVINELASIIGEDKFNQALKTIYNKYSEKPLTSELFIHEIEALTGRDLRGFANSWLYSDDYLDYGIEKIDYDKTATGWRSKIKIGKKGNDQMPVTLTLKTEAGDLISKEVTKEEILTVESLSKISAASIDEGHNFPDENRLNNDYPRKNKFSFSLGDFPSDALAWQFFINPLTLSPNIGGGYYKEYLWRLGATVQNNRLLPSLSYSQLLPAGRTISLDIGRTMQNRTEGLLQYGWPIYQEVDYGSAARNQYPINTLNLGLKKSIIGSNSFYGGILSWQHETYAWTDSLSQIGLEYAPPATFNSYDYFILSALWDKLFKIRPNLSLDALIKVEKGYTSKSINDVIPFDETEPYNILDISGGAKAYSKLNLSYPVYRFGEIRAGDLFYCRQIVLNLFMENTGLWNPQALYFSDAGARIDYSLIISPVLSDITFSLGYALPLSSPANMPGQSLIYFKLDLSRIFGMIK